eukprot:1790515-Pyramimonas_sp.AAC.1
MAKQGLPSPAVLGKAYHACQCFAELPRDQQGALAGLTENEQGLPSLNTVWHGSPKLSRT